MNIQTCIKHPQNAIGLGKSESGAAKNWAWHARLEIVAMRSSRRGSNCTLKSETLCQEDFHCHVALRNYERAWYAGRGSVLFGRRGGWILFPRSLEKKKFCCKKEGIACKAEIGPTFRLIPSSISHQGLEEEVFFTTKAPQVDPGNGNGISSHADFGNKRKRVEKPIWI